MGQLLHYALAAPLPREGQDIEQFMVIDFVNAVRDCFKVAGFAEKDKEQESGGVFLVGFRGQLYRVAADYQVGRPADGYDAVGCGDQQANGSLFSTVGRPPETRIRTALSAAEHHSAGVRAPFVVHSV